MHRDFYATAAQVIPVLILTLSVENQVFTRRRRHNELSVSAVIAILGITALILAEILSFEALSLDDDTFRLRIIVGVTMLIGRASRRAHPRLELRLVAARRP